MRKFMIGCACVLLGFQPVHAAAFDGYGSRYRALQMPHTGAGSGGLSGDCLSDGRLISLTGRGVYVETGIGTGVMSLAAVLDSSIVPAGRGADPAFMKVSPDGTRLAMGLGLNLPVVVVPLGAVGIVGAPTTIMAATPGVRLFNVAHSDGAWRNNGELALAAGSFGSASRITLLDTNSSPAAPVNPTIIGNIGGASGGVAFDRAGRLFTGNGFDLSAGGGASTTGTIKAFAPSLWSSGPADFENAGALIGDVLSASGMSFDVDGNLAVGGFGDGNDFGYLGVIRQSALSAAIASGLPVSTSDPSQLKRLTPDSDPFAFYGSAFNPVTGELYATVSDFSSGANTWYATVPAPGAAAGVLLGLAALRRRR